MLFLGARRRSRGAHTAARTTKAPPERGLREERDGLLAEVLEALVELLDATGGVHDALLARVERVRCGRDLDVDDGVLDSVELDGLVAGHRRTGDRKSTRLNSSH